MTDRNVEAIEAEIDESTMRTAVGDEIISARLAAEQAAAAIDLSLPSEFTGDAATSPSEVDGAQYSQHLAEVVLDSMHAGPETFRQRISKDMMDTLSVYGNESFPVLSDGGTLAHTTVGMFTDRVQKLDQAKVLTDNEEVVVWVVDNHGIHARVFMDALRKSNPAVYARTRVVLLHESEQTLHTIQAKNALDGHERVDYQPVTNLATMRHAGQAPLAILAPDLPNQREEVHRIYKKVEQQDTEPEAQLPLWQDEELDRRRAPHIAELTVHSSLKSVEHVIKSSETRDGSTPQKEQKIAGDTPLVTIDPASGLTELVPLDNLYRLGTSQTAEGRRLILDANSRLQEPSRDVPIMETNLRRHGQSAHAALARTQNMQLYNFMPASANPLTRLIEQLSPHGMFLTSGFMNHGEHLEDSKLRHIHKGGAVTMYTAEIDMLRRQANNAHVDTVAMSTVLPVNGEYGYALFDTTRSTSLRSDASDRFAGKDGVQAPDERTRFLSELTTLADNPPEDTDGRFIYDSLIEKYPRLVGNYDLIVEAAKRLNARHHPELAVSLAESAIQYAPHVCTSALIEAGKAYVAMNRINDAERMLNWAVDISPNAVNLHAEMMKLYREQRDWDRYIVTAGRYLRDSRGLTTKQTISVMRTIMSAAELEKSESARDPLPSKTVVIESIRVDQDTEETYVERQVRHLPCWLMAAIKAADLSANYANTVRRLLDYSDDLEPEEKIRTVDWFNKKYELHALRLDPSDPDSLVGERELWPDRAIRALWPDLPTDRTHRLIYTGESTLADDEAASPQPLLNMVAKETDTTTDEQTSAIEILKDELSSERPAHIELGLIPDPYERLPSTRYVALNKLNSHILVVGESGAGKSVFCRNLLEQMTAAGVPWLVIEVAKSEYGAMAGRLEGLGEVYVHNPSDPNAIPASLNFLAPEPGFPILRHIGMLQDAFLTAFEGTEPFPQIMSQALVKVYESHGWDMTTGKGAPNGQEPTTPTIEDLISTAMEVVVDMGYGRNLPDVQGFVRTRITSLGIGSVGKFLEGTNRFNFADLQSRNVVLKLDGVGDDNKMKAFLSAMFLAKQYQFLTQRDEQIRKNRSEHAGEMEEPANILSHFTMIEEAARLLKVNSQGASDAAIGKIADIFRLGRAYSEGYGAICQSIDGLHADVVRNTAVKVVFRTPHGNDQKSLATLMNLEEELTRRFSALKNGQAYVYVSGDTAATRLVTSNDGARREREMPNRTPPPIYGKHESIRQANENEIHEAEIAIAASTPEGAWMRSWIEFMTISYVASKKLPDIPQPLREHMAELSPLQRRLQVRQAIGHTVARRTSALITSNVARLKASIESAAHDIIEHNVGAGTLPPAEFTVPQLALLHEDTVVHRPFHQGLKADPGDIAPPLEHHIVDLSEHRGQRTTFAERSSAVGRHAYSMRHPNEKTRHRNIRIGYTALFGTDGAQRFFDEDLALATGESTVRDQVLAMTRAMDIAGSPGMVGWGPEVLSWPKRIFHRKLPPKAKAA